jgi:deoxyribodipyrimidine photolyase-related protein
MTIFLLFPIHLFKNIDNLKEKNLKVYLIEDNRYFIDFKYHKLKLAYHRASMKSYFDYLKSNKINVEYLEFNQDLEKFYKNLKVEKIKMYDPNDHPLEKKIKKFIPKVEILNTLNFLVNKELIEQNKSVFFKNGNYNHVSFYKWQRIRLNILVDNENNPRGGKWSFDEDNRKKLPNNVSIPSLEKDMNTTKDAKNKYIIEAIDYTKKYFPENYGSLEHFIYPINHDDAKKWLLYFLKNKFENFGPYEDAETERDPFLFHSVLTPMMNNGLLTDEEVIKEALKYESKVSIASMEGFIRQIIGWRNYIYTIYVLEGESLKKMNFMNHQLRLNNNGKKIMWEGKTQILPIDNIINKIDNYAYAHHIERLMYLGNYLLLCMIHPDDVFEIFMEWTIDAYDWVMVANVYGMTQFADGGMIMTRPYFSSSNYILKMSDYKNDKKLGTESWCNLMDTLYYNFINTHQEYLSKNYATSRQVAFWNKKSEKEKKLIIKEATEYLTLFSK